MLLFPFWALPLRRTASQPAHPLTISRTSHARLVTALTASATHAQLTASKEEEAKAEEIIRYMLRDCIDDCIDCWCVKAGVCHRRGVRVRERLLLIGRALGRMPRRRGAAKRQAWKGHG